jgi:NTP pyrophosphatase (non-canonical NTP hydrolase)
MNKFWRRATAEAVRAAVVFPDQEHTVTMSGWLGILVEEVGEVARELNELELGNRTPKVFLAKVTEELVQVAAMAERMADACRIQVLEEQ